MENQADEEMATEEDWMSAAELNERTEILGSAHSWLKDHGYSRDEAGDADAALKVADDHRCLVRTLQLLIYSGAVDKDRVVKTIGMAMGFSG